MSASVMDAALMIRSDRALASQAASLAQREGISRAEWIRRAMRDRASGANA